MNDEEFTEEKLFGVMYYFRFKDMFFNISMLAEKYHKTLQELFEYDDVQELFEKKLLYNLSDVMNPKDVDKKYNGVYCHPEYVFDVLRIISNRYKKHCIKRNTATTLKMLDGVPIEE